MRGGTESPVTVFDVALPPLLRCLLRRSLDSGDINHARGGCYRRLVTFGVVE